MDFSERLKTLRTQRGLTQEQLAHALDIPDTSVRRWESAGKPPKRERLEKLADFFGVSVDFLLGRTDDPTPPSVKPKPYYALTEKDERDIARDLERIMNDLESNEALAFYGEPMDEETRNLIRLSLEHSMRLAKEMAKKKYTPKKYRGGGENDRS